MESASKELADVRLALNSIDHDMYAHDGRMKEEHAQFNTIQVAIRTMPMNQYMLAAINHIRQILLKKMPSLKNPEQFQSIVVLHRMYARWGFYEQQRLFANRAFLKNLEQECIALIVSIQTKEHDDAIAKLERMGIEDSVDDETVDDETDDDETDEDSDEDSDDEEWTIQLYPAKRRKLSQ